MNQTAIYEYTQAGLYLIPIPPVENQPTKGPQGPNAAGWNRPMGKTNPNGFSNDPEDLIRRTSKPGSNLGLALEPSKIAAIDLDDLEVSREALALADIDLDALMEDPQAVRIESRPGRGKLLYRVPQDFDCCSTKLVFGEKGKDERAIFELRYKGSTGATLQDVLPPSIHPDTGKPYELIGDITKIPHLPQALTDLWTHWEEWRPVLQSLDPQHREAIKKAKKPQPRVKGAQTEASLILSRRLMRITRSMRC